MHRIAQPLAAACLTMAAALPAAAQSYYTEFGMEFVTVGAVGNAAFQSSLSPLVRVNGRGTVDYEFRITRTELPVSEFVDFLFAYQPFATENVLSPFFTGSDLVARFDSSGQYQLLPGFTPSNGPAHIPMRQMARYINWIHNDRALTAEAFAQGVYDTTTFGVDDDGRPTDDYTRSVNARYWIPNIDELLKAMYYDPNRFGAGEGGYWLYPNSSDEVQIIGRPEDGGQTNAGLRLPDELISGLYPDQQSPWGLLDGSGGVTEGTSDFFSFGSSILGGSSDLTIQIQDRIDFAGGSETGAVFGLSARGFRIATNVPTPGGMLFLAIASIPASFRRRMK